MGVRDIDTITLQSIDSADLSILSQKDTRKSWIGIYQISALLGFFSLFTRIKWCIRDNRVFPCETFPVISLNSTKENSGFVCIKFPGCQSSTWPIPLFLIYLFIVQRLLKSKFWVARVEISPCLKQVPAQNACANVDKTRYTINKVTLKVLLHTVNVTFCESHLWSF